MKIFGMNKEIQELFLIKNGDTMFLYHCNLFNEIAVINIIISVIDDMKYHCNRLRSNLKEVKIK